MLNLSGKRSIITSRNSSREQFSTAYEPFIAFQVDPDSAKFTEITKENDMEKWKAAQEIVKALTPKNITPRSELIFRV